MRINKYLAACELGSRRKVEEYILAGKITINGAICKDLAYDVSDNDVVLFNGKEINPIKDKVYIMLNKPKCYITSLKDEKDRRVVTDLLKSVKVKVFPVGRLDYNTEGLLLLTNDGDWANSITHPSKHICKTYEVKLKYMPTNKQLNMLKSGIVIDGKKTLPAKVSLIDQDENYYYLNITIYEGRNREIRKMFEALNLKICNLKRLSIGELQLGNLEMGKFKYLSNKDKDLVFMGD